MHQSVLNRHGKECFWIGQVGRILDTPWRKTRRAACSMILFWFSTYHTHFVLAFSEFIPSAGGAAQQHPAWKSSCRVFLPTPLARHTLRAIPSHCRLSVLCQLETRKSQEPGHWRYCVAYEAHNNLGAICAPKLYRPWTSYDKSLLFPPELLQAPRPQCVCVELSFPRHGCRQPSFSPFLRLSKLSDVTYRCCKPAKPFSPFHV